MTPAGVKIVRHISHGLREIGFLLLATVAAFLFIALASYVPADPAWTHTGTSAPMNLGGVAGAWFADIALYFFGYPAYLFPLGLVFAGWRLFKRNGLAEIDAEIIVFRTVGFLVTVGTGCGLAALHLQPGALRGSAGGIVGDLCGHGLINAFGPGGGTLFLAALFLAGVTLASGLSWLSLVDLIGKSIWDVAALFARAGSWVAGRIAPRRGEAGDDEPQQQGRAPELPLAGGRQEPVLVAELPPQAPPAPVSKPVAEPEKPATGSDGPAEPATAGKRGRIEPSFDATTAPWDLVEDDEPKPPLPATRVSGSPLRPAPLLDDDEDDGPDTAARVAAPVTVNTGAPGPDTDQDPEPDDDEVPQAQLVSQAAGARAPRPVVMAADEEEEGGDGGSSPAPAPVPDAAELVIGARRNAPIEGPVTQPVAAAAPIPLPAPAPVPLPAPAAAAPVAVPAAAPRPQPPARAEGVSEAAAALFGLRPKREVLDPLPPLELLDLPREQAAGYSPEALDGMSRQVESKLAEFGVDVTVVNVEPGPVVTRFELDLAPGVKVSQISNLAKDVARGLSVVSVRVVEVIPGKSVIGLEIPNRRRQIVSLREIIAAPVWQGAGSPLTVALGHDIGGRPVVGNLAKMPHVLVAGTTGSGKSVAVNCMLISMLYKAGAEQLRLILIDPKMLELSIYEGIPHLLAPVVTDMKDAANALRWCVAEMERRYRLMAALRVRNIAGFNKQVSEAIELGEPIPDPLWKNEDSLDPERPLLEPLPYVVVVIDELADMMMIVGKKVEELIARLAQKARAAGIHLILATQRPSVDVITGLIKANIPTRIALTVASKIDSRTILDQMGAEALLGHGDMLYLPPGTGFPQRVHGAFVDDHEVNAVVEYLKQTGEPDYVTGILDEPVDGAAFPGDPLAGGGGDSDGDSDPLYDQAVRIVVESRRASVSGVQRRLKIGYNRAARLVEEMERAGIVGPIQSNGSREVLVGGAQADA
ncbi:MAG TPA: DNA translocase FtsK 4TM domain-containing protein [Plasticicumulans sp.]|uniref:DNA translocase FtsK n=2 Tax=Plasticicumulans sp. TaxID=2307179 RepID=UPI002BF7C47F|nr:DNA translocase FtsK 4TM domain-containing protein [Plasticicumulans sp.]HMW29101.1 DNA translocase FtsK 4TM domain-containing protein [Plasticicumulans sp.]